MVVGTLGSGAILPCTGAVEHRVVERLARVAGDVEFIGNLLVGIDPGGERLFQLASGRVAGQDPHLN